MKNTPSGSTGKPQKRAERPLDATNASQASGDAADDAERLADGKAALLAHFARREKEGDTLHRFICERMRTDEFAAAFREKIRSGDFDVEVREEE